MIFAFIFLCFLSIILYRFRLRKASNKKEILKLAGVFFIIGLFLIFIGLFYLSDRDLIIKRIELPVTGAEKFKDLKSTSDILLKGKTSKIMPVIHKDFVAYIAYDDEGLNERRTPELLIDLPDGEILLGNNDYAIVNWPLDIDVYDYNYLKRETDVIIVGTVEKWYTIKDGKSIEKKGVRADFVFAGTYDDYLNTMKKRIILPEAMFYISCLAGLITWLLPPIYWIIKRKSLM